MALYPPVLHRMDVVNVRRWILFEYTLSCQPPYPLRKGLILKLEHEGQVGWGEIAPLPERNRESLEEAKKELLDCLNGSCRSPLSPSVRIGWESAQHPLSTGSFPLCALLAGTPKQILDKADQVEAQGYETVKVKLSSLNPGDAFSVLTSLLPRFQVRIDLNRSLSLQEALAFFSQFSADAFDFIEEPLSDPKLLSLFPFPFALDESLPLFSFQELQALVHLKAIVLKPTGIGNQEACVPYLSLNKPLIFSSSWESGVGMLQICALSARLEQKKIPLGLDTYRFFEEDLLVEPLDFSSPLLVPPPQIALKPNLIQEIAHG